MPSGKIAKEIEREFRPGFHLVKHPRNGQYEIHNREGEKVRTTTGEPVRIPFSGHASIQRLRRDLKKVGVIA